MKIMVMMFQYHVDTAISSYYCFFTLWDLALKISPCAYVDIVGHSSYILLMMLLFLVGGGMWL